MTKKKDEETEGGIHNSGTNYGIQAGRDLKVGRDININSHNNTASKLQNFQEVLNIIDEVQTKLKTVPGLKDSDLRKINEDLDSAKNAVSDEKPDAKRAYERLNGALDLIKNFTVTITAMSTVIPLLTQAVNYLHSLVTR